VSPTESKEPRNSVSPLADEIRCLSIVSHFSNVHLESTMDFTDSLLRLPELEIRSGQSSCPSEYCWARGPSCNRLVQTRTGCANQRPDGSGEGHPADGCPCRDRQFIAELAAFGGYSILACQIGGLFPKLPSPYLFHAL